MYIGPNTILFDRGVHSSQKQLNGKIAAIKFPEND